MPGEPGNDCPTCLDSRSSMARIIKGQIVASTALDAHGERLTVAELARFASEMPSSRLLNVNHELTRPPVARAFNNRLDELPDGTAVIRCDVEVLDEAQVADLTGMSISFHRQPDTPSAEVMVSFNPKFVERARLERLVADDDLAERVTLAERSERALIPTLLVIYVIVAKGFWNEAGADLYRLCKRLAQNAFADRGGELVLWIKAEEGCPEILVRLPTDLVDSVVPIDVQVLAGEAQALAPGNSIIKIVAAMTPGGTARIEFAVDDRGTTFAPSVPDQVAGP